ncbi:MAG: HNH endonuclease [Emergencia sp.]|nr:HNH endonuclease [Emergencia sp.]
MLRKETQHHPLEGKTIYGWEVMSFEGSRNNKSYYWCKCRCCGQLYLRRADKLLAGRTKRCGECAKGKIMYEGEVKAEVKGPNISKKMREKAYERFDGHCAYCGKPIKYIEMEMDFLLPVKYGGEVKLENLLPSCRVCNRYRKNRKLEQFRSSLERIPKTLTRDSGAYRIAKQYGIIQDAANPKVQFWFEQQRSRGREDISDNANILGAMDTIAAFCRSHNCEDCPMEINCSHQLEPREWISNEHM